MKFSKKWVAIPFPRGSSQPRDRTWVSHIAGRFFTRCLSHQRSTIYLFIYLSVRFSRSVMSDCLQWHGWQHTRVFCPSPTPGAYSNSCPLSWWCHPTISSSVSPFSSHLQSFPASGSFPMSQLFTWGGQRTGVSASILQMNTQDWSPSEWTGWISFRMDWLDLLAVQGTLKSLLQHHSSKASIL